MNPLNLSTAQILAYIQGKLPCTGWFAEAARISGTVAYALCFGLASALSGVMGVAQFVALQIYLQTTSGDFLDLWAYDFFGTNVLRKSGESDLSFMGRLSALIFAPTVTKAAITQALSATGFTEPVVREAFSPKDTGAFGAVSYFNAGSRFGSRGYPGQIFVEAGIPSTSSSGTISAFGESYFNTGPAFYASPPIVALDLADLYGLVNLIRAAGIKAWVKVI